MARLQTWFSLWALLAGAACSDDGLGGTRATDRDPSTEPTDAGRSGEAGGDRPDAPGDASRPEAEGDGTSAETDAEVPPTRVDGADESIKLFEAEHVYFLGGENRREIDTITTLPEADHQYQRITLDFALRCPSQGGCDAWDRHGHLSLFVGEGDAARELELLRFVTPYRKPMDVSLDVTDLRPILTGAVKARVFIDTWVGPGHEAGAGWLVDATLRFAGGTPPREVLSVVPVWPPTHVVYGDPGRDPTRSEEVKLPEGATSARLWTIVTGHGQGNASNCAEFCPKEHALRVGERTYKKRIWRDDCASTAVPDQPGTWTIARAGWCPGAGVHPWIEDVSGAITGDTLRIEWSPDAYTNTCRQGVPDDQCSGCVFGTGCDYNGNSHTEPYYQLSSFVVLSK